MDSTDKVGKTGISVAIGFGNMSMISKAYTDAWNPGKLRMLPFGSREPCGVSHQVISSGHYCTILSVVWDDYCKPKMHIHTTFHDADLHKLPRLIDQLKQECSPDRGLVDPNLIHQKIRSNNYHAFTSGKSAEAPMIIVEDEPLYDMHQFALILVDLIFKEKRQHGSEGRR